MDYAKAQEIPLSSKPYTTAIQNWFFGRFANEPRFAGLVNQQVAMITTTGLTLMPDGIHFNKKPQCLAGHGFAQAMRTLMSIPGTAFSTGSCNSL
ncbi:MAG TPA: hypothetical protein VK524_14995 [Polyangiaceae bacterium]|nr:hypothetical protein [Polyangiaceae bacterium]